MNERDWSATTGLPSSMNRRSEMNVAQYCRSYIQDEWRRLSPSTRKSYVEALTSLALSCARSGASTPLREWRGALSSWLMPTSKDVPVSKSVVWVWSDDPLPRNFQSWLNKNSPLLGDLDRETLYETDRRMRVSLDGVTPYAPSTQSRLVTVAKTALSTAVRRVYTQPLDIVIRALNL